MDGVSVHGVSVGVARGLSFRDSTAFAVPLRGPVVEGASSLAPDPRTRVGARLDLARLRARALVVRAHALRVRWRALRDRSERVLRRPRGHRLPSGSSGLRGARVHVATRAALHGRPVPRRGSRGRAPRERGALRAELRVCVRGGCGGVRERAVKLAVRALRTARRQIARASVAQGLHRSCGSPSSARHDP